MIRQLIQIVLVVVATSNLSACKPVAIQSTPANQSPRVDVGVRPWYLIEQTPFGTLRTQLQQCLDRPVAPHPMSIAHRGAPLQFPEHTRESYIAAARMGAGRIECDVSFTKDAQLVCRHSECDLHQTTNILATSLNDRCTVPWGRDPKQPGAPNPNTVRCCTSDLTLTEFKSLKAKMDGHNPLAATTSDYLLGTPRWRTDLYARANTLLTHAESIELINALGADFIPELKFGDPERLQAAFGGATPKQARERFAQKLLDEYRQYNIPPNRVILQSFEYADIEYWLRNAPNQPLLYLLRPWEPSVPVTREAFQRLYQAGVRAVAPPIATLLRWTPESGLQPTALADAAVQADMKLYAWTLERTDPTGSDAFDLPGNPLKLGEAYVFPILHALVEQVGVAGVFTDWPATVTYYANCLAPPSPKPAGYHSSTFARQITSHF